MNLAQFTVGTCVGDGTLLPGALQARLSSARVPACFHSQGQAGQVQWIEGRMPGGRGVGTAAVVFWCMKLMGAIEISSGAHQLQAGVRHTTAGGKFDRASLDQTRADSQKKGNVKGEGGL